MDWHSLFVPIVTLSSRGGESLWRTTLALILSDWLFSLLQSLSHSLESLLILVEFIVGVVFGVGWLEGLALRLPEGAVGIVVSYTY
jgi:hypothetical protein